MKFATTNNRSTYFNNLQLHQSENFPINLKPKQPIAESIKDLKMDARSLEFSSPVYNPFDPTVLAIVHTKGHPTTGGLMGEATRGKTHGGIDIKAEIGTPIKAAEDGVVVLAGNVKGYGNVIYLNHRSGFQTRYAHLNNGENGIKVKVGDVVRKGETIGESGKTGNASGSDVLPHLHFEIREINNANMKDVAEQLATSNSRSRPLDPIGYIAQPAPENKFHLETPELNLRKDYQQLLKGTYEY